MNLRYFTITVALCCTVFSINSQNYILHPNINPQVNLSQEIDNDNLLISDVNKIYKVNLYNRTTKEVFSYQNNSEEITIPLNSLKSSYYSIMVHNGENRIIVFGIDIDNTLNTSGTRVAKIDPERKIKQGTRIKKMSDHRK